MTPPNSTASAGYPILLNLAGRACVVVGGGRVAERKVAGLLDAGGRVTVISPTLTERLAGLAHEGTINHVPDKYSYGMLASIKPLLVFAATDSDAVNRAVADEARETGTLMDVVSEGGEGDFSTMPAIRRGRLTLAISTGGSSPALVAHLRERLEAAIGPEYVTLLDWMAEMRPIVRERIPAIEQRRVLWHAILNSQVLDLLRGNDLAAARIEMETIVAAAMNEGDD
jgi:precorrin-2 dehydrogenase / sirohydrochlorin ferrochelatase